MSKMTPEERQRRRDRVATEALESVAKSEQFNFRMDADTIKRLYAVAAEQRKPVGALVREWVLEKIEGRQQTPTIEELMHEIRTLRNQTITGLQSISSKIDASRHASPYLISEPTAESIGLCRNESGVAHPAIGHCPPTAESASLNVPVQQQCPTPHSSSDFSAHNISKAQLSEALKQLKQTTPGSYEVPSWLVDFLKINCG
jgi:hypothetical protein